MSTPTKSKFNLDDIINSVKSLISPVPAVPKSAEDDPMGFRFAEIGRFLKEIGEANVKQADLIAKANSMLTALYKEFEASKQGGAAGTAAAAPAPALEPAPVKAKVKTATAPEKTEEKK